jgi:GT2 family glycosyltransferase
MTREPSVSAVVTYHESPRTLARVLHALHQQVSPLDQIVIVDNGSRRPLQDTNVSHPGTVLIRAPEGTSLSRARNLGVAATSSELVLLLDDDMYLAPDCLRLLVAAKMEMAAAVVCPRIVIHPEDSVIQCDGAEIHFAGMLVLAHQDTALSGASTARLECGAFIGACLLVSRQLLLTLGGFNEDYFFYFEDLELSYRLRALGHPIWCEPLAVAFHDRGPGTPGLSFRGGEAYPARRVYFTLRHRWLTMILHYSVRTLLVLLPAFMLYEFSAFLECLRRGWLWQLVRAVWSLLRELPRHLSKRGRWQRARRVGDGDILIGGPLPFARGFADAGFAVRAVQSLGFLLDQYWLRARRWL